MAMVARVGPLSYPHATLPSGHQGDGCAGGSTDMYCAEVADLGDGASRALMKRRPLPARFKALAVFS